MGVTQSQIMSRLRIKCFLFESWAYLNQRIGKHFQSRVDLNQYLGIHSTHELIQSQFLESRLSNELNRFKFPRYCFSHELIRINLSGMHLSRKPLKGHTKLTLEYQVSKIGHQNRSPSQQLSWMPKKGKGFQKKVECPKKVIWNWEWIASLCHELIQFKILKVFFESWVDLKNFRNAFWVFSWFESIPVTPLWVMSCVESKLSETELNRIKKWVVPYPCLLVSVTRLWSWPFPETSLMKEGDNLH